MINEQFAAQVLNAITAATSADKAAIIAAIQPPGDGDTWAMPTLPHRPGRPPGVNEGIPPRRRRGIANDKARAQFLHAIWHIEYSAIDLALLCSLRGSGMPQAFHIDQLRVAAEEAVHADMMADLLHTHNHPPGHDAVHHKLWDTAINCDCIGEQLVVVPRFLEARGLDVNADIIPRFAAVDSKAAAVLQRIYDDEIGHVGIGSRWHRFWCEQQGIDSSSHFRDIVAEKKLLDLPNPAPLDTTGRHNAGFNEEELAWLALTAQPR